MKYRILGRTGLEVSLVGLGTGGPSRIGQRTHGDETMSHRVVHRALDLGINLIDTAADYGDSELILGRALKDVPRDRYLVATKFNPDPEENDSVITPQALVESCERSLKRLQTETIDIYQFHGLVPSNYRIAVDRLYPAVEKLREAGKIRFVGVTEHFFRDHEHQMLHAAMAEDIWDTIMVKYGILNLSAERTILPHAKQKNVGVFNMSAVRVKLSRPDELSRTISQWKQRGLIAENMIPDRGPLDFLVHDNVNSVVRAGYKFGISHDAISSLLIGTGSVEHLEENVETIVGSPLPAADVTKIRTIFGDIVESEGDTG
jgi:L-galactose dehydrogenase